MKTTAEEHDNIIDLNHHPRTWTDPKRVERFLKRKRVDAHVAKAAVRFAGAVPPLTETLPRSWTAPLIASLPDRPTPADLEVSVAGAARYFEYLDVCNALPRGCAAVCEYDLLAGVHVVEALIQAGFDRERMAWEEQQGAAEKVQRYEEELAKRCEQGIAGAVSWLGGWVQCRGTWVVLWVPAGGGVAVAGSIATADQRPEALADLYMKAFLRSNENGGAAARLAVFSTAQERAMRDFAREVDIHLLPLYRLRAIDPLRFWAEELVLG